MAIMWYIKGRVPEMADCRRRRGHEVSLRRRTSQCIEDRSRLVVPVYYAPGLGTGSYNNESTHAF